MTKKEVARYSRPQQFRATSAAHVLNRNEYPRTWHEYVGQGPAKRTLQIAAKSAKIRGTRLDHVLIAHGTPGIGKTALAALVADTMGTTCRVVSGQINMVKARMLFAEMKDRDVLFYDEFHQVMDGGKKNAEWLLTYLQDGTLTGPRGVAERQPDVTIVGATTEVGKLPRTIVERFPLIPPMQEYNEAEAARIVTVSARKILKGLPTVNAAEAAQLAAAAHHNPRAIQRLLLNLRDMTITEELPLIKGRYDVRGLLDWQGITPDGLDLTAQQYLYALGVEFGGMAGAKALEDRLQQPGGLATVERVLMDMGLLAKTSTGRVLTQAGIARFHELAS